MSEWEDFWLIKRIAQNIWLSFSVRPSNWYHTNGTYWSKKAKTIRRIRRESASCIHYCILHPHSIINQCDVLQSCCCCWWWNCRCLLLINVAVVALGLNLSRNLFTLAQEARIKMLKCSFNVSSPRFMKISWWRRRYPAKISKYRNICFPNIL